MWEEGDKGEAEEEEERRKEESRRRKGAMRGGRAEMEKRKKGIPQVIRT